MSNKSAIRDIFHGVRGHMETMTPSIDKKNMGIVCDTYDELKKRLSPELLELHQKLVDALERNWAEEVDFFFTEGFKLGVFIGIECTES